MPLGDAYQDPFPPDETPEPHVIYAWAAGAIERAEWNEPETAAKILRDAHADVERARARYTPDEEGAQLVQAALDGLKRAQEKAQQMIDEPF